MCLAVPLKLIEINGKDAVGEAMGLQRKLRVDFIPEPKIGDYVIVHAACPRGSRSGRAPA